MSRCAALLRCSAGSGEATRTAIISLASGAALYLSGGEVDRSFPPSDIPAGQTKIQVHRYLDRYLDSAPGWARGGDLWVRVAAALECEQSRE